MSNYHVTYHQVSPETLDDALAASEWSAKWAICHNEGGLEYSCHAGSGQGWHSRSYQSDSVIALIGAEDCNAVIISADAPKPRTYFKSFEKMYESLPE